MKDTYKTIEDRGEGLYKEKGSKFISLAIPVLNEDDVKAAMDQLKKDYHDARHHCYAFCIGKDYSFFRFGDDGEPSGTAGRPIYNQILSKEVTNVLLVVIRYFGGTKLGASGLANAYKTAAREALENVNILQKQIQNFYEIVYDYPETSEVMKLAKDENINVISQDFEIKCKMTISVQKRYAEKIAGRFRANNKLEINYLKTE
ncbi:MAG: YigZ family protein [Bacteroidales bacterium]|nr:YigZ family protein [Bacteroidales bacterium]MCF8396909.1 YigZ family protein [Bacteroidales bacterium]